ncbi:MAG: bifunctional methylenetetrahydrofolate dehydrogenase/methenyltetrahydrofolate cyclohydrolase FolD [Candidatus Obscuribacterales bacterium]|nr:bifunctional methylenetetrahydrofolate dehydrogenase/methenyltetrahydrofolate cyclohydrolase FolD [Candidatus Obscuribacterales bacterium]
MSQTKEVVQTGTVLDGTACAKAVREALALEVQTFVATGLRPPGLAVVLVGDDPASKVYVKNKVLACKKAGIESFLHELPGSTDAETLLKLIDELNQRADVDGILVQLPLPAGLPTDAVLMAVSPEKDADGLHPYNLGLLLSGKAGLRPCTPSGIIRLLDHYNIPIEGKSAVVIGRSNLVGKPISILLMERNATVTMCHSRSKNLEEICRGADILVVAAGRREMVAGSWVKPGAVVIDVGIHKTDKTDSGLTGDVIYPEAKAVASHITPVPGGIGPMTVAMLLSNTFAAYKKKHTHNK